VAPVRRRADRSDNGRTGELESSVSIFVDVRVSFERNWVARKILVMP